MTEQEQRLLDNFKRNLTQLIQLADKLKADNNRLDTKNNELNNEVSFLKEKCSSLSRKYEDLKLAKTLINMNTDGGSAKQKIDKLVREIDDCIAQLNS